MKNLRISRKLMVSALITVMLTALVGAVGIYGLTTVNSGNATIYDEDIVPIPHISEIIENVERIRINVRQFIIYSIKNDTDGIERTNETITQYKKLITENLNTFDLTIHDTRTREIFDKTRNKLNNEYVPHLERAYKLALAHDYDGIIAELDDIKVIIDDVVEGFDECMSLKIQIAEDAQVENQTMAQTLLIAIISILIAAIVISLVMATYIAGLISKPLVVLSKFMKKAGTTGNIEIGTEDIKVINEMSQIKDELGQTIDGAATFIRHVTKIAEELEIVASGDLTISIKPLSETDTMGNALLNVVDNLNRMFEEIQTSTQQVSSGSKQVADGSQFLAQGATEQAASIEQLSSSIAEIAEKTKENAVTAGRTSKLSDEIKENAQKGTQQMNEMMAAVHEINDASHSISKIIKTIDDIAFQTNILALNAAVEAARAGHHGKGFAVVAEEVRNLAAKSAEAAKETGDMIQNSMEKAEFGSSIAGETANSLTQIVTGINESSNLIAEIARATEEQSLGISQINTGLEQVTHIVQQNSATAQESAAASEEMSSQSVMLYDLISQFQLREEKIVAINE